MYSLGVLRLLSCSFFPIKSFIVRGSEMVRVAFSMNDTLGLPLFVTWCDFPVATGRARECSGHIMAPQACCLIRAGAMRQAVIEFHDYTPPEDPRR
jgi:hypothetical protein